MNDVANNHDSSLNTGITTADCPQTTSQLSKSFENKSCFTSHELRHLSIENKSLNSSNKTENEITNNCELTSEASTSCSLPKGYNHVVSEGSGKIFHIHNYAKSISENDET